MPTRATQTLTVPLTLTNDRSTQGILNTLQSAVRRRRRSTASQTQPAGGGAAAAEAAERKVFHSHAADHQCALAKALGYDAVLQGAECDSERRTRESPTSITW